MEKSFGCVVFVGGISYDVSRLEYEREVQKWGNVVKAYYHGPNSGWGTVEFGSKDYRDKFVVDKVKHVIMHQLVDVKPYETCAEALVLPLPSSSSSMQHQALLPQHPVPQPDLTSLDNGGQVGTIGTIGTVPGGKKMRSTNVKRRRELSPNSKAKMYSELKVLRATTLATKGKKRAGYVKELADKYNVHPGYPSRLLRKIDLEGASIERRIRKGRPKVMTEDKVQMLLIILRRSNDKTIEQIAREIGVSKGALYGYMKQNKLLKAGKTIKPKTEEQKAKRASANAKKRAEKRQQEEQQKQQVNHLNQLPPLPSPNHMSQNIPSLPPLPSEYQVPVPNGGQFQHPYPEISWLSGFPQNHHSHHNQGVPFGQRPIS